MTKTCIKCKEVKLLAEFHKDKTKPDGYRPRCKVCRIIDGKVYYNNNIDLILNRGKLYRGLNKERETERSTRWINENPERAKEYQKCYRILNREREAERVRAWRYKNPEKRRASDRKRRARKQSVNENYTKLDEQYTRELFNNCCVCCDSTDNLCVDHHYPLSKGNPLTRNNAVLLCRSCNCSKGAKLPEEFYPKEVLTRIKSILNNSGTCHEVS